MEKTGSNKDYVISVAENCKYISIKYFVDMTTEVALRAGPELMKQAKQSNLKRFLFDMLESSNIQSVTDNYYFANENIRSFDFPRDSMTAFILRPDDHSHDFIINAFLNAGYYVEKFSNEEEAIKWLCDDQ